MNGVTGRMGLSQHLIRSVLAIREQGGLRLPDGEVGIPDPILVGRNEAKLRAIAEEHGVERYTTDLDRALDCRKDTIYFDAQTTSQRYASVKKAIERGKHIYCEKPVADNLEDAIDLVRLAKQHGVKTGVVQDKLYLPGIRKLKRLIDSGFFGRLLSIRGEFGYWVFEGDWQEAQRPSWNYRKEDGGGIIFDMFCHWRYLLEHTFGTMRAVSCLGAIHIPERVDEQGQRYLSTAEDAAYATFQFDGGLIAQMNSSWCVRVYRDELLQIQVDGTHGSAIAGLRGCKVQPRVLTPKPVWNPDLPNSLHFVDDWKETPDNQQFDNAFKVQWENFLRHVYADEPYSGGLLDGAKGVQLAELASQSWRERRWVDVPALEA